MRRIILAVSGGIDSMTLLWLYHDRPNVIVAHFNHGTRPSSDDDEAFVRKMAASYGLPFMSKKVSLGESVSEAEARAERYRFLREVAAQYDGEIYLAHHADDVIETMAINLLRGTSWRGLAVMGNDKVSRPLLKLGKSDIYKLASQEKLVFRQDPTNAESTYLRNRIREKARFLPDETKAELLRLYRRQSELASEIDHLLDKILPKDRVYQRAWFRELDDTTAIALLRAGLARADISATRPQLRNFLNAIRTYPPEKSFNLPGDRLVRLHKGYFVL